MSSQKIMRILFLAVPVLLFLSIFWHFFAPFLSLAVLSLIILFFRNTDLVRRAFGLPPRKREPIVYYQPSQQQEESPPRPNLKPGFDLTPEEYRQLSQQYQQGYQPQTSPRSTPQSTSWSPFLSTSRKDQLKEERPADYEQPLAQYPEQKIPPMP